jgi:hypothetical protein
MLRLQLNHYDTMFSLFMLTIQGLGVKNGAYLISAGATTDGGGHKPKSQ